MNENTVRDRKWQPIVDQLCFFVALLSQNKATFLLKIILIYDDHPTERPLAGTLRVVAWWKFKRISRRGRRGTYDTFDFARKWCRVLPVLQCPFLQILQTAFSSLVRRAACGVCVCACDVLACVYEGKCGQAWNSPWSDFDTLSAVVAWKYSVLIHY